jgi:hypothetical protein
MSVSDDHESYIDICMQRHVLCSGVVEFLGHRDSRTGEIKVKLLLIVVLDEMGST